MAVKTKKSSKEIGEKIKARRKELNLTIEEAARKAGIGTKTWSRYEAGESIREDKAFNVLTVLGWWSFDDGDDFDLEEFKSDGTWSTWLEENYGLLAALSFSCGIDLVHDYAKEALLELSRKPKGTHIGEIDSILWTLLPDKYLMRYDYDFIYKLNSVIEMLKFRAKYSIELRAHSVIEEIVLYMVADCSEILMDDLVLPAIRKNPEIVKDEIKRIEEEEGEEIDYEDYIADWKEWPFNLFGDADLIDFLYSKFASNLGFDDESDTYDFDNWFKEVFYMDEKNTSSTPPRSENLSNPVPPYHSYEDFDDDDDDTIPF